MRGIAIVALLVATALLLEACRRRWQIGTLVLPWLVTIDLTQPVHQVVLTTDTILRTVGPVPLADTLVCVHLFQDHAGGHQLRLPAWAWREGVDVAVRQEPNARTTLWLTARKGSDELIAVST